MSVETEFQTVDIVLASKADTILAAMTTNLRFEVIFPA